MNDEALLALAREEGFIAPDAAVIPMDDVVFEPAFRPYCEANLCGQYGANYACPPDCGTPEAMEARMRAFPRALVVRSCWDIPDWHDVRAVMAAKQSHNAAMLRMLDRLTAEGRACLMGGASCCGLCPGGCARRENRPCPFPERRYSCLSAYCIHVARLAESCGMVYNAGEGKVSLFGVLAVR